MLSPISPSSDLASFTLLRNSIFTCANFPNSGTTFRRASSPCPENHDLFSNLSTSSFPQRSTFLSSRDHLRISTCPTLPATSDLLPLSISSYNPEIPSRAIRTLHSPDRFDPTAASYWTRKHHLPQSAQSHSPLPPRLARIRPHTRTNSLSHSFEFPPHSTEIHPLKSSPHPHQPCCSSSAPPCQFPYCASLKFRKLRRKGSSSCRECCELPARATIDCAPRTRRLRQLQCWSTLHTDVSIPRSPEGDACILFQPCTRLIWICPVPAPCSATGPHTDRPSGSAFALDHERSLCSHPRPHLLDSPAFGRAALARAKCL